MNDTFEFMRRYHPTRFLVSALIGALTGTIFVGILWILILIFRLFV